MVGRHFLAKAVQGERVPAPFAPHQVQPGKTQNHRRVPSLQNHAQKTDGPKIRNTPDPGFGLKNGDFKLDPTHRLAGLVRQFVRGGLEDVCDVILSYHQIFRTHRDLVLKIGLRLVHGLVPVDVFLVRHVRGRRRHPVYSLGVGIPLRVVETLVPVQNIRILVVQIVSSEILKVVSRGVLNCRLNQRGTGAVKVCESLHVGFCQGILPTQFVGVGQSVHAHILKTAGGWIRAKCFRNRLVAGGVSPCRGVQVVAQTQGRKSIFETLPAVLQDVFAQVAQVKIDISPGCSRVAVERIHHPKLDELDVLLLEIVDLQGPHQTAPAGFGVVEFSYVVQAGRNARKAFHIKIIGTSFLGIKGHVEHGDVSGHARLHRQVGEYLVDRYHPLAVVRQDSGVLANVLRGGCGVGKERRVNDVPRRSGPVEAVANGIVERSLREQPGLSFGHAGQGPRVVPAQVDLCLGAFKVVDVGGGRPGQSNASRGPRKQLGHFALELQRTRFLGRNQRQFVQQLGDLRQVFLELRIQSPNGVVDGLLSGIDFLGQRPLAHVQQSPSYR